MEERPGAGAGDDTTAPEWRDVSGLRRDAERDTGDVAAMVLRLLDTTPAAPAVPVAPDMDERVEAAAEWLHSWAGDQIGYPWERVGPARKLVMRARARGVLNILQHGHPGNEADVDAAVRAARGDKA